VTGYVVCVDDEQAVLDQLSAQLTRRFGASHRVECAESAEEALALIDEIFTAGDEVELVICDQVMPRMKGDRFLQRVHETWPRVMKILLTGQAGLDSAIDAINNAGLHCYIEKPWEVEDLNLAVESLLTQHRLRHELELYHTRLELRGRELHGLHDVGRALGAALEPERVLRLVADAARSLAGSPCAVVVQAGRSALWECATPSLAEASRRDIEATLVRLRAEGRSGPPPAIVAARAVALDHGPRLFGWLMLLDGPEPSPDTKEFLSILAGQAAAALHHMELLEERLRSERLSTIGRMITTIVHDFRNPMTAIKGYGNLLAEDLPAERRQQYARLIVEETNRLGTMIEEILEFTRGEPATLRPRVVTVSALADAVERMVAPELKPRSVALCRELGYEGELIVDVDRVTRALLNFVTNALDAMPAGGTLTLASRRAGGRVGLEVSDTGVGIPEELLPRLFEPFFTHGKPRGLGLGMSIARKIVEEHGGEVSLESRSGEGTRVTLWMPLEPPALAVPPRRRAGER
jgi:signal transduction histidine kinase/DNA-binding response OmpR family regulator